MLYSLLFHFSGIGQQDVNDKSNVNNIVENIIQSQLNIINKFRNIKKNRMVDRIADLPGTQYIQYKDYDLGAVVNCACYEDDILFDDYMVNIRVVGHNYSDGKNNALSICKKFFPKNTKWENFIVGECSDQIVNLGDSDKPALGLLYYSRRSSKFWDFKNLDKL